MSSLYKKKRNNGNNEGMLTTFPDISYYSYMFCSQGGRPAEWHGRPVPTTSKLLDSDWYMIGFLLTAQYKKPSFCFFGNFNILYDRWNLDWQNVSRSRSTGVFLYFHVFLSGNEFL
jgi:hypothetical protein